MFIEQNINTRYQQKKIIRTKIQLLEMIDITICNICLSTNSRQFNMSTYNLREAFESLSGLNVSMADEKLLDVCCACAYLLMKYDGFRRQCRKAQLKLKNMYATKQEITAKLVTLMVKTDPIFSPRLAPSVVSRQHLTTIVSRQRKIIKRLPRSVGRAYNFMSVDIAPVEMAVGKRNGRDKDSGKLRDVVKVVAMDTGQERRGLSAEELNVEEDADISFGDNETMDDYNTCDAITNDCLIKTLDVTQCAVKKEYPDEDGSRDSFNEYRNSNVTEETSKAKSRKVNCKVVQELDFAVVSFLNPLEQRAEVQKRKTSLNYVHAVHKCELCYRGFMEEKTFLNHQQKHDEGVSGRFECDICHVRFRRRLRLREHINTNHTRKFTCRLCPFTCFHRSHARSHYSWHKGVTFTCEQCGEIFKTRSTHLSHLRIKHPSEFKCSLCSNTFVSEAGVIAHRRLAHRDNTLKSERQELVNSESYCAMCGVQFESVPAYTKHVLTAPGHCTSTIVNGCVTCGETFASEELLKLHSKSHSRYHRPVKCIRCNLVLKNSGQYVVHRRSAHPSAKMFICEWCGKSVSSNAVLRDHIRIHTGEKPYKCQHCPKEFNRKLNLDIHLKSHSDERPFPCPTCGKAFKLKNALERHEMIHNGLRPFKCTICEKAYNQSTTLKLHIRAVHNKEPWPVSKKRRERRAQLANKHVSA